MSDDLVERVNALSLEHMEKKADTGKVLTALSQPERGSFWDTKDTSTEKKPVPLLPASSRPASSSTSSSWGSSTSSSWGSRSNILDSGVSDARRYARRVAAVVYNAPVKEVSETQPAPQERVVRRIVRRKEEVSQTPHLPFLSSSFAAAISSSTTELSIPSDVELVEEVVEVRPASRPFVTSESMERAVLMGLGALATSLISLLADAGRSRGIRLFD